MNQEKSKPLGGIKYKWLIVAGGILGVALILLGSSGWLKGKDSADANQSAGASESTVSSYTAMLEKKVAALVRGARGGDPAVLITLDCSSESVYAENARESASYEGGSVSSSSSEREYLILSQDSGDGGLLLREIYPKIRGIAVVCAGGDTASVQLEIIQLLSVAFGISSSKVCVSGTG